MKKHPDPSPRVRNLGPIRPGYYLDPNSDWGQPGGEVLRRTDELRRAASKPGRNGQPALKVVTPADMLSERQWTQPGARA